MSIGMVAGKQNPDGGWPYVRGVSWTEPTVYAILAMLAAGEMEPAKRGLNWLRGKQMADGGWAPQAGVDDATWVTSLVALIPPEHLGEGAHARAIEWTMATRGQESTATSWVRGLLLGNPRTPEQEFAGWPWVPGAAAWVGPTALAILALDREQRRKPSAAIRARIDEGRHFLLRRMCRGGGWNHGSVRSLGYESGAYPESTGLALAALARAPEVDRSIPLAHQFLTDCRSADALNWLRLGLLAHGQLPAGFQLSTPVAYRTVPDTSLNLLVEESQKTNQVFWRA